MEKAQITRDLQKVGLSEKAAVIYAALLEIGGAYPSKIAEYTKLNRSTTYKVLEELSNKGLVNEIKKRNKIFYQIGEPQKLVNFAKDKIEQAKLQKEYAEALYPEIAGLFALTPHKPRVLFYEGMDGVLELYTDHVDGKEPYTMQAFSNASEFMKVMPEKFKRDYVKAKEKLGVKTRGIIPDTAHDKKYNTKTYKSTDKKIWPKLKFVPAEMFPYKNEITIYKNNRVSIVNFGGKSPMGVIIEDQDIHDMMNMIFNLAWAGADKI
ncbi:hypothetical protein KJ937_01625 [Patescibacteria group bacterium]|nr:hypothetical protein [Patescibacteria group bacterium]